MGEARLAYFYAKFRIKKLNKSGGKFACTFRFPTGHLFNNINKQKLYARKMSTLILVFYTEIESSFAFEIYHHRLLNTVNNITHVCKHNNNI